MVYHVAAQGYMDAEYHLERLKWNTFNWYFLHQSSRSKLDLNHCYTEPQGCWGWLAQRFLFYMEEKNICERDMICKTTDEKYSSNEVF